MPKHLAECQCGQFSASCDAEPDFVIACNCKACQRRTGSPFGAALYFKKADVVVSGEQKSWTRSSDSGRALTNHFCPECGTTLAWTLEMRPNLIAISYGCLSTPTPEPNRAIWTEQQHSWVAFPDDWQTYEKGSPR